MALEKRKNDIQKNKNNVWSTYRKSEFTIVKVVSYTDKDTPEKRKIKFKVALQKRKNNSQ